MSVAAGQQQPSPPDSHHERACVPGCPPQLVAVAAAVDDALAAGDVAQLAALYAPTAQHRSGGVVVAGRDDVVRRLADWRAGRSGVEILPTRVVADDRSVAWERMVLIVPPGDASVAPFEATCATLLRCDDDGAVLEQVDVWSPEAEFV
jgi:hypothetical protein